MFRNSTRRQSIVALCIVSLLLPPLAGCGGGDGEGTGKGVVGTAKQWANAAWTKSRDASTGAWKFVSEKSSATWTVVADKTSEGGKSAWDASKSAMVWTQDRSVDGWEWISANVTSASQWAADAGKQMWMVTQDSTGEFFLWVKVEAGEGVAYVKTAVPAAWKVTKDAAGQAWVWVGEHKLQAATVAATAAIVVTALMIEPVTASSLIAKGVVTKAGAQLVFRLFEKHKDELDGVTEEQFAVIAEQVIGQNAEQAAQTKQLAEAE